MSEIRTKLCDWAIRQAVGSCYSWAALFTKRHKDPVDGSVKQKKATFNIVRHLPVNKKDSKKERQINPIPERAPVRYAVLLFRNFKFDVNAT